jgi:hypothetical protein
MILSRFGPVWAGAYQLGQANAQDDFPLARPPTIAQVGGTAGAFDFFGDAAYPLAPVVVKKSFKVSAATWALVETALDNLKRYTIGAGRSVLWGTCRDNSHRWAYAKCIGVTVQEINRGYLRVPVEVQFQLTEGVWYADSVSTHTFASSPFALTSAGTYRAMVKATLHPSSGITSATLTNTTTGYSWTYAGVVAGGQTLIVDSAAYSCTLNGANAYAGLSLGASQLIWMYLAPGVNNLTFVASSACGMTLTWLDTFL